jgi:hypothetical protein
MQTLNHLHFDSAPGVEDGAVFCDPLSFHCRMKNTNITQKPTIAAQAIVSIISVNMPSSPQEQSDTRVAGTTQIKCYRSARLQASQDVHFPGGGERPLASGPIIAGIQSPGPRHRRGEIRFQILFRFFH